MDDGWELTWMIYPDPRGELRGELQQLRRDCHAELQGIDQIVSDLVDEGYSRKLCCSILFEGIHEARIKSALPSCRKYIYTCQTRNGWNLNGDLRGRLSFLFKLSERFVGLSVVGFIGGAMEEMER